MMMNAEADSLDTQSREVLKELFETSYRRSRELRCKEDFGYSPTRFSAEVSELDRLEHGPRRVPDTKLRQDFGDVILDRSLGNEDRIRNLFVCRRSRSTSERTV